MYASNNSFNNPKAETTGNLRRIEACGEQETWTLFSQIKWAKESRIVGWPWSCCKPNTQRCTQMHPKHLPRSPPRDKFIYHAFHGSDRHIQMHSLTDKSLEHFHQTVTTLWARILEFYFLLFVSLCFWFVYNECISHICFPTLFFQCRPEDSG